MRGLPPGGPAFPRCRRQPTPACPDHVVAALPSSAPDVGVAALALLETDGALSTEGVLVSLVSRSTRTGRTQKRADDVVCGVPEREQVAAAPEPGQVGDRDERFGRAVARSPRRGPRPFGRVTDDASPRSQDTCTRPWLAAGSNIPFSETPTP
jgi:hypothetical protein